MSVCWRDGGESLRGVASPSYKNGKWSAFVPEPLLPTFTAAIESGDLLSGMRTLGMMAAREEQLLKRLDTGESGKNWAAVRDQLALFRRAARNPDEDQGRTDAQAALREMERLATQGQVDAEAWEALFELWERARKISDTEMRRREKARVLVPIEDVLWHTKRQAEANRQVIEEFDGFSTPEARSQLLQLIMGGYEDTLGSRVPRPQLELER